MLSNFYPLKSQSDLQRFFTTYIPLVDYVASTFSIDIYQEKIHGDHLGLQVLSAEEFEDCSNLLINYSELIRDHRIHDRRNRVYRLNIPLQYKTLSIPLIEIFEPKPSADLRKLKPGIEHIAFNINDYDEFVAMYRKKGFPVDKEVDMNGSKFFKTSFVNLVEVEFRNDSLAEISQ